MGEWEGVWGLEARAPSIRVRWVTAGARGSGKEGRGARLDPHPQGPPLPPTEPDQPLNKIGPFFLLKLILKAFLRHRYARV